MSFAPMGNNRPFDLFGKLVGGTLGAIYGAKEGNFLDGILGGVYGTSNPNGLFEKLTDNLFNKKPQQPPTQPQPQERLYHG